MRTDPANGRQVAVLPLAVTLGVHLLLVAAWLGIAPRRPAEDQARRVESVLVRVAPLPTVRPAPAPRPAPPEAPKAPDSTPPRAAPPVQNDASTIPAETRPSLAADDTFKAPLSLPADELLSRAKKQAGPIDRALGGAKSGPKLADTPWTRFQDGVANAYNDRSRTTVSDMYTAPDGIVTYRFRQGGKVWCRRSGGVAPDMIGRSAGAILAGAGSAGSATTAGTVECPSGEREWARR